MSYGSILYWTAFSHLLHIKKIHLIFAPILASRGELFVGFKHFFVFFASTLVDEKREENEK